jgi:hypothetical protein
MKLIQFPTSQAIVDADEICTVGEAAQGKFVVAPRTGQHAAIVGLGDYNALLKWLKDNGRVEVLSNAPEAPKVVAA